MTNSEIDTYIKELECDARGVAVKLRALILRVALAATEAFKWSRPCYQLKSQFCSFVACKGYINLAFNQGAQLEDPDGLLEGTGKAMRHVKVQFDWDKLPAGVEALVKQAAEFSAS